jgi:hypothetical protein
MSVGSIRVRAGSRKELKMGDRSLIVIKSKDNPADIVFYGHWSGGDNLTAVREVLAKTGRIGDSYLVAELFYEFAVVQGMYEGLGFGSFGIWSAESGADEGWTDAPTIYVNLDNGSYEYEGETITNEELRKSYEPKTEVEEPNLVYGGEK